MSWNTIVPRIPHIFEAIFSHLDLQDRLSAASTCHQWQTAIFGRDSRISKDIALNVTYDRYSPPSSRCYEAITVKPWIWGRRKFQLSLMVLEAMNGTCPIRWARFDGRFAEWNISPSELMAYGKVFGQLQVLELNLTLKTFWNEGWDKVFADLSGLISVKMTGGHGRVLSSVRTFCRGLKKLELIQFALTKPLGELLDFPELEDLIVRDLDVAPSYLELQTGVSQLAYKNLKHLTFLLSPYVSFVNLTKLATTIKAPELQSARVSDNLYRFVRIQAGEQFHDLTLNITTSSSSDFDPSYIFRNDLQLISKLTIETASMKYFVETIMSWIKGNCSNVKELIFEQEQSPLILQQVTEFAIQQMGTMPAIVCNSNPYQKSCFALERGIVRRGANNQQGEQNNPNQLEPDFNWN